MLVHNFNCYIIRIDVWPMLRYYIGSDIFQAFFFVIILLQKNESVPEKIEFDPDYIAWVPPEGMNDFQCHQFMESL